ncbi:hypothetical protein A2U01_0106698, partial [Trifolium medium]|nr:hypothetical protein [Trifolium medium]
LLSSVCRAGEDGASRQSAGSCIKEVRSRAHRAASS